MLEFDVPRVVEDKKAVNAHLDFLKALRAHHDPIMSWMRESYEWLNANDQKTLGQRDV